MVDYQVARAVASFDAAEARLQAAIDAGLTATVANDCHVNVNTGISSVSLASIGGQWIVSHFLCGADGRADTDKGEIQVSTFASEKDAREMFRVMCDMARWNIGRLGKMRKAMLRGKQ